MNMTSSEEPHIDRRKTSRKIVPLAAPEELSLDLNAEFHIRADQMSTAYRKALVK
jgi:hypothetical protein